MKKEWSIKKEICSGKLGQDCIYMAGIELLRKKLIDDVKEFYANAEPETFDNFEEYFKYRGQRIIDEIINKRFGV